MTKTLKGIYTLLIKLDKSQTITIGKMGKVSFSVGYYAYVGSAMNGLEARIVRHLKKDKVFHWHIDYLLRESRVVEVFYGVTGKNKECMVSSLLAQKLESVPHFGCSDCHCHSHLFCCRNIGALRTAVRRSFKRSDLVPHGWW